MMAMISGSWISSSQPRRWPSQGGATWSSAGAQTNLKE